MATNVDSPSSRGWLGRFNKKQKVWLGIAGVLVVALIAVLIWLGVAGKLKIGAAGEDTLTFEPAQLTVAKDETQTATIKNGYKVAEQTGTVCLWIPNSDWNSKFVLIEPDTPIGSNQVSKWLERSTDNPDDIKIYIKGLQENTTGAVYFSTAAGCSACETSGQCGTTGNPVKLVVNVLAPDSILTVEPAQLTVAKDETKSVTIKNMYKASEQSGTACLWIPAADWGQDISQRKFDLVAPDLPIGTNDVTKWLERSGDDIKINIKGLKDNTTGAIYLGTQEGCSSCETSGQCGATGNPVKLVVKVGSGGPVTCSSNADCDDNDKCTTDLCNTATSQCSNQSVDCPSGQTCNSTSGQCETGGGTTCTNGISFTFIPNAWNIKANTTASDPMKIYDVFGFLGSEKPVRAFTYPGSGQAYLENGSPAIGEGFWFTSGATSPVCIPPDKAVATTQKTAPIKGSIAMVGNPTSSAVKWGDVTITINGVTTSILEASNKSKPDVKAMFTYPPSASDYTGYYAAAYPSFISNGGNPLSSLMTQSVNSGDGAWIILNSGITSAILTFP